MNLSVIILTYNEQLHLQRCIENVKELADEIFVVDCFSTDGTQDIARRLGATVVEHAWPGNQAEQMNWALDNLPLQGTWILRLDADEWMTAELIQELRVELPLLGAEVGGLLLLLRRYFMGKWIRHAGPSVWLLRLFRRGWGRCEKREMDEHIVLSQGDIVRAKAAFVDDNLNSLIWWTQKHLNYAEREMKLLLSETSHVAEDSSAELAIKRRQKGRYAKLPLFWRAAGYFFYRYILRGGFLDGKEGFLWHFLQALWYRTFVDALVFEKTRRS
ncbi:MAG: glycosyltransferase family 2 protein [Kiritimatiellia bacterium]